MLGCPANEEVVLPTRRSSALEFDEHMKIRSVVLVGCLLTGALWAAQPAPAPAPAATAATFRVGVINVRAAILSTQEGKAGIAKMEQRFGPKRQQLQDEQKQLQTMQQQLQQGANTLSADAQAQLQDKIQRAERRLQEDTSDAQQDFESAGNELVGQVMQKMMPLLQSYASGHGFAVILDSSVPGQQNPLLYASASTNIGPDIVKLYDQKYPAPNAPAGSTQK
jgi:Skp family chaperone for outer membrane proteins